jgi:hypothetical protein
MKSNRKGEEHEAIRVELKYCEHCGGLWVREPGAGVVCGNCAAQVADLPLPKKKAGGRLVLPVRGHTLVEEYAFEDEDGEGLDFEAAGGVA